MASIIKVQNLRKVYRVGKEKVVALDDICLEIGEGEMCCIVGASGSGKSTLLNLLAGFDRAIVTPVAGTTRDVVEQAVQLGDIQLNLFDTAGLRETEDAIEAEASAAAGKSWRRQA